MILRHISILFALTVLPSEGCLHAATKSSAGPALATNHLWTNEDLERLSRVPGLISVFGQATEEAPQDVAAPRPKSRLEDPAWYAAQTTALNARLEAERANLRDYTKALDDARELKAAKGGVNLVEDDIGITPQSAIDILQSRVRETLGQLDALEDLARRNNIPPGILRGQEQGPAANSAVGAAEQPPYGKSAHGGNL